MRTPAPPLHCVLPSCACVGALTFDGSIAKVSDVAKPDLAADSALVRVTLAGVCNTDLELVKGYMAFRGTLGHEFVGVVEDGPPEWRPGVAACMRDLGRSACDADVFCVGGTWLAPQSLVRQGNWDAIKELAFHAVDMCKAQARGDQRGES